MGKQKRVKDGLLIKHAPPMALADVRSTVYISTRTPFVSALKRINKALERLQNNNSRRKYVHLVGMGAAIDKTFSIALKLQQQGCRLSIETSSKIAKDEIIPDDETEHNIVKDRYVGVVDIKVYGQETG